jgi:hypothetical protein
MMFRRKVIASASAILAALLILFGTASAYAVTTAPKSVGGNGMRVSPVTSDLTIKPGASQIVDVYVTNLTSQPATLQGIVDDFTANPNETGTPAILLNGERAPSHSLKGFVEPIGQFTLAPDATQDVKVTINIPAGTAGGGYFGVVRFAPAAGGANGKNVNLTASVGSLLLVTVPGKIVEQMSIASFDVRHINAASQTITSGPSVLFTSNKNLGAIIRFDNTGNLQEAPFGNVLLKKGKTLIATYQVNSIVPRTLVLPDSIRHYIIPLTNVGSFGRYTIETNIGYGSTGQLLAAQTSFYVIPVAVIVAAVIILIVIIGLIILIPRLMRSHDRSILRRAGRGKSV